MSFDTRCRIPRRISLLCREVWNSRMRDLKQLKPYSYSADPILGTWIKTSSQWREMLLVAKIWMRFNTNGVLFSLDAVDSFDLQEL